MFKCRINSESSNPTVVTLKNTLNKMLDSLDDATTRILRVMSSYTNDDYSDSVKVYEQYTDEMRELMLSINKLGEALGNNAKANLNNGQTLEHNSATMTASMNNLAAKANEQAASLEETAAAVEEITSITRNNAENATKMAELGKTVRTSVTTGEDLASKTASSMDEINDKVTS
ncbi:MAG: methyl-accepting chemotaxis protein, partial [Halarcobacter sp.]